MVVGMDGSMGWLRRTVFHALKAVGGFAVAQRLTRRQLRILCYHGFSITDEHELAPYVFMRLETFERRMRILHNRNLPVVSLEEGLRRLTSGELKSCETVLTFDDGWSSNLKVTPILMRYGYPACVYVTTEHFAAGTQAFNVTVTHLIHASRQSSFSLHGVHAAVDGDYALTSDVDRAAAVVGLLRAATEIDSLSERQALLPLLARALGIDYHNFVAGGRFQFVDASQLRELIAAGISVEMHSHSHNLPDTYEGTRREIETNRAVIFGLTGTPPTHFCYPSGRYSKQHPQWLPALGIASATTCDAGMNDSPNLIMRLRRYLDSDTTSDIEFEAEVAGLRELYRKVRSGFLRTIRV